MSIENVNDLVVRGKAKLVPAAVQEALDEAVRGINGLQEEFDGNGSEIETVARDCIGSDVGYILDWFNIPIDVEEAIRERDW